MKCPSCGSEAGGDRCANCGAPLPEESDERAPGPAESTEPQPSPEWFKPIEAAGAKAPEDRNRVFLKYFAHGAAYSIILLGIAFVWVFMLVIGAVCGGILGIIIVLGLFMVAIGAVNAFLADVIWSVKDGSGVLTFFVHGLILFILLALASIPSIIITRGTGSILLAIILFIIYCPIDGYIAKYVADEFKGRSYKLSSL